MKKEHLYLYVQEVIDMGVPIINGLGEMASFNQYASTQSYVYGSVAEALDSGRYMSPPPTPNQLNATGAQFQVVEFQPELTGGTKAGSGIVDFVKGTGRCETFVYGSAIALSGVEILAGIIAGLGLSIASYELNKDFWVDVSNNAFQNFPGYTPVTYDNIEDMSIIGLFRNNKTYVPYEVVQSVANYLISIGAYDINIEVEIDVPMEAGNYTFQSSELTYDNIRALISKALNKANFGSASLINANRAVTKLFETIPGNYYNLFDFVTIQTQLSTNAQGTYQNCSVTANFGNITQPISKYISGTDIHPSYPYAQLRFPDTLYNVTRVTATAVSGYDPTSSTSTGISMRGCEVGFYYGTSSTTAFCGTSTFNNNIEIIPRYPELTPLPNSVPTEVPNNLPLEFPEWWANRQVVNNPETETPYLPVSVPSVNPKTHPVPLTTSQPAVQTGVVPETNPKPVADSPTGMFEPTGGLPTPSTPTPTPTPTPVIPIIPAIGGQANKLFTVYNPSQANLDALGATLWTQNIITQIVQMFTNNPMDAIISLHILYATPTTGANKEIKLGYVPTGVSCPEVTNQYVNVDCGTVRVPELFGDARDYANTDISIYLPMIGFRQLKTEDAMGSVIGVDYRVDVFTGTVLATVTITKAGVNQVFYTYEGNCAVNLPLTGADKSRQMATAIGAVGAMVTGSPLMALGSATAIAGGSARAQIQRSGNFTGNAGAMGCKKPYIIVSSDVAYDAVGYNTQYGYPANLTVMLGTCNGYVKVKEVHADTISNATEQEKRDIENQLKQGIIIH